MGQFVYALDKAGFKVTGIDYAPKILNSINMNWPHLDVQFGDVRNLQFLDESFDGYWSIGVIEHFAEGYDEIAKEAYRVLRVNGIMFLSFPMLSPFRQMLARKGKYTETNSLAKELKDFYQFALNPVEVIDTFKKYGFDLKYQTGLNSIQGIAEDSKVGQIIDNFLESRIPKIRSGLSLILDSIIGNLAGHSKLLILQKLK